MHACAPRGGLRVRTREHAGVVLVPRPLRPGGSALAATVRLSVLRWRAGGPRPFPTPHTRDSGPGSWKPPVLFHREIIPRVGFVFG